jgi:hypothetical protein
MRFNSLGYGDHPLFSARFQRAFALEQGQQAFQKGLLKYESKKKDGFVDTFAPFCLPCEIAQALFHRGALQISCFRLQPIGPRILPV